MTLSEALKTLYASGGSDVILDTLSFNHSTWETPFYIVRDYVDLVANLEDSGPQVTFNKFSFNIQGPNKNERGSRSLQITLDNVGRTLTDLIETAVLDTNQVPIEVIYRMYLASDTSGPQNDPPLVLQMKNITVNTKVISGEATNNSLINKKFPNVNYGTVFQGLYYK